MLCEITGRDCPTLDEHHVIPREYGGINGPTVNLDPAVHQAIHRYVNSPAKLSTFLSAYPSEVRARIMVLVKAIQEAQENLDKKHALTLTITLTKEEYDKLSRLAKDTASTEASVARKLLSNLLS